MLENYYFLGKKQLFLYKLKKFKQYERKNVIFPIKFYFFEPYVKVLDGIISMVLEYEPH